MQAYIQTECKKYLGSFFAGFTLFARTGKPVICENSDRAGAKYRRGGAVECRESGNDPNTRLSTLGPQSIFQSCDHQRGNV